MPRRLEIVQFNSYPIQIISKQIYLIFKWDPNRYHHSSLMDLGVMTMMGCLTPNFEGETLPLCRRYSQHIVSPINKVF